LKGKTADFRNLFQSADWKTEKYVPVIEAPDKVKKAEDKGSWNM